MTSKDIEKTLFNGMYGEMKYYAMTISSLNVPATFQPLIKEIFHNSLGPFFILYINDLIVFIKFEKRYYKYSEIVFE